MEPSAESGGTKRCCTCGATKPFTDFNRRRRSTDGRQARCRDCFRQWHADNRERHNAQIHARTRRVRRELFQMLREYLDAHPCVDCGLDDVRVLKFDHVGDGDKVADVTRLIRYGVSWDLILREIAKCEVCCANCHRIRTYDRAGAIRACWIRR